LKKRKTSKLKISDFTLKLVSTERISEQALQEFFPKRTFCRRHYSIRYNFKPEKRDIYEE
jgi:hypothetical protein